MEFNIYQVKRNKEFIAVDIQIVAAAQRVPNNNQPVYQGFIAALKDAFGFIETIDHDREVFFHFR